MGVFDYSAAIKITFDRPITVDPEIITGTEFYVPRPNAPHALLFSNQYDTGTYAASNVFDSDITTGWWAGYNYSNQYVGKDFGQAVDISKIRVYLAGTRKPKDYKIQASSNGSTWVDIVTGQFENVTGWVEISITEASYRYWRLLCVNAWNSYIYVYELQFLDIRNTYDVQGWEVTAQEYNKIPGGESVLKTYTVRKVTRTPDNMAVILWLDLSNRLLLPIGQVTVSFSGTLVGSGGVTVDPFVLSFTPTQPLPIFNPNDQEYISGVISNTLSVTEVVYSYNQSGHAYLNPNINDPVIVVTNVGGLPL